MNDTTHHPLVTQLGFARSEWQRGLEGVTKEEAVRRFLPMNSISWIVGHLAWQEHLYWVVRGQGENILPELQEMVGSGWPASTPPYNEMRSAWDQATSAANRYLDGLTGERLTTRMVVNGRRQVADVGTMLQRMIYHYWFHIGEVQAIRQLLGHTDLPQYVGDIEAQAPYKPH